MKAKKTRARACVTLREQILESLQPIGNYLGPLRCTSHARTRQSDFYEN